LASEIENCLRRRSWGTPVVGQSAMPGVEWHYRLR